MTNHSDLFKSGLRVIATNSYSANDTWSKPAGAVLVEVILCGGGGGGGSSDATDGGQGGNGGFMVRETFPASGLASTVAITIGAGGTGGASTADGGTGGSTSFGAHLAVSGGGGRPLSTPGTGMGMAWP